MDFLEETENDIPLAGVHIILLPLTNATNDLIEEHSGGEINPITDNLAPSQLRAPAIMVSLPDDNSLTPTQESHNMEVHPAHEEEYSRMQHSHKGNKKRKKAASTGKNVV